MKYILLFVLSFFLSGIAGAQNNRSSVRLTLSDGSPLKVTINNRDFNKIGTSLIVGDIPGRRPHIQVYRYRAYADGRGGKAELVYSGTIKIKRDSDYDAIIDVQNRELLLKEVRSLNDIPGLPASGRGSDQMIREGTYGENSAEEVSMAGNLNPQLQTVKDAMDEATSDMEKLKVAERYLGDAISAADAKYIASWFFFDDTKLKFAKEVYPKVSDKEHFEVLKEVFSDESSQKEFAAFLKGR